MRYIATDRKWMIVNLPLLCEVLVTVRLLVRTRESYLYEGSMTQRHLGDVSIDIYFPFMDFKPL